MGSVLTPEVGGNLENWRIGEAVGAGKKTLQGQKWRLGSTGI